MISAHNAFAFRPLPMASLSLGLLFLFACGGPEAIQAEPSRRTEAPAQGAALQQAEALGTAFSEVAERVSPAVVSLRVEQAVPAQNPRFFGFPGMPGFGGAPGQGRGPQVRSGSGSGVVIRGDGYILTNHHVVQHARRIQVVFRDGRELDAQLVGSDPATDLAVVRVEAEGLVSAVMADPEAARVGEWTIAIGAPFGLSHTVTTGVLSAKGRGGLGANEIEDYLQTDASINPGNSGGPLCNLRGEVLGINTMIIGRGTGIGFAIPSDLAGSVAQQIIGGGRVQRSWLGVQMQALTPELASHFGVQHRGGTLIQHVTPDSPAAKAGIQSGDVITALNGTPIREGQELLRQVLRVPVGQRVTVTLVRRGQSQRKTLVTEERPSNLADGGDQERNEPTGEHLLGLQLQSLTPELRRRLRVPAEAQLLVSAVASGSDADRAGLRSGDVILAADHQPIQRQSQLEAALQDGEAMLQVVRRTRTFFTVLRRRGEP